MRGISYPPTGAERGAPVAADSVNYMFFMSLPDCLKMVLLSLT